MYSKNNKRMQEQKNAPKAQRFSLRKLSIGTVSVLLGTLMFVGGTSSASADEVNTATTSTDNATATTTSNNTDSSEVTLKSSSAASDSSDANSGSAAAKETATVATAAATTAADTNSTAATSTASAKVAAVAATTADTTSTDTSTTATDNVGSGSGTITDDGKAKGLTDSDATPAMSDDNGASVEIDNSGVPSGYEIDPTTGRYTFGIANLSGYNTSHNTNYYFRVSTNATGDEEIAYIQLVDANTNTVVKEYTVTPNSGKVQITELSNEITDQFTNKTSTVYYEAEFIKTTDSITHLTSRSIGLNSKVGTQYMQAVYDSVTSTAGVAAGLANFTFPTLSTKETKYIAKDAAGNETVIAIHDETGKLGQKYTISGVRDFKGYDLISSPSEDEKSGTLALSYKIGDKYVRGYALRVANDVYAVKLYEVTGTDGSVLEELYVARGISTIDLSDASSTKKIYAGDDGKQLTAPSLDLLNDPTVWKLGWTTTIPIKPGEWSTEGNAKYDGKDNQGYKLTEDYLKSLGFSDNDVLGATSNWQDYTGKSIYSNMVSWPLSNALKQGQESADYYYAPQGQVRINYVLADGTVIQAPKAAYENSGTNTSYDVTNSTYCPATITVNGKTYRYVKADKSLGTAGVNGYTYTSTPSDATGTIKSNTVNDVYFVYEQVTYKATEETKTVTRTIEYYDSVTGEKIPSNLEDTVTQTATMTHNEITDDQGNFIGYGTVSADGSSYTLDDSWKVADQTWTEQTSKDLSSNGYTAPDKASVAAVTVDGNTTDVIEKVYYGHQTTPVAPGDTWPSNVSDADKVDLSNVVKRTIKYVDADGNAVKGAPDGSSEYIQQAEFKRTAIVDNVTGKILGYDTNNDGKVDTEDADRAWTPIIKTMDVVKSADPTTLGYKYVDKDEVSEVIVVPGQADLEEKVVYSNDKSVSGTIYYIDDTTLTVLKEDVLPTAKVGEKINYNTTDTINDYKDQGYELVSSTFTNDTQTYAESGNDFYVHLKHQTEAITPNNPATPGDKINHKGDATYPDGTAAKDLNASATRTIKYYDKQTGQELVALAPEDVQMVEFGRTAVIDKVTGEILGYDTDGDGIVDTKDASAAWKTISTQTNWTQIDSPDLSAKGYQTPDIATVAEETPTATTGDSLIKVYYDHATTPVKPGDEWPSNVADKDKADLTKTIKRTITYVDTDGNAVKGAPDGSSQYTQEAEFTRTAIVDKVTGKVLGYDTDNDGKVDTENADRAWMPISQNLAAVTSTDATKLGYGTVDTPTVSEVTVLPSQTDLVVKVTYGKNPAKVKGSVEYIDDTTGEQLDLDSLATGTVGSLIDYTTAEKIAYYEARGYELVSNNFNDGGQFYANDGNNFVVHLKHQTKAITPKDPATPGDKINPKGNATYPSGTTKADLSTSVTRTIKYFDKQTGKELTDLAPENKQTVEFTRTVIIDKVTGQTLGYDTDGDGIADTKDADQAWTTTGKWTVVNSPDLTNEGYQAPDITTVAEETPTVTTSDKTIEVYYDHATVPVKPGDDWPSNVDGKDKVDLTQTVTRTIKYVDAQGKAVNGAPDGTSVYKQKAEFTRTAIVDKVTGEVLGYDTDGDGTVDTKDEDRAWTPVEKQLDAVTSKDAASLGFKNVDKPEIAATIVTPGQANLEEEVVYSNGPEVVSGTIKYIDDTTGQDLSEEALPEGEVDSLIKYETADKIKSYENRGYELVSNNFTDGTQKYAKDGNTFEVHLKHQAQTVTPNDPTPVKPGQPINPNDPDSPVYPSETDRSNLVKDATQTVHYIDNNGNKVADDKVQTQKDAFTRTVTVDKVTGKVIATSDWTGEKTFGTETTPFKKDYHADKKTAGGLTATVDNPNVEDTVTYTPNGKIIPVDPDGNVK